LFVSCSRLEKENKDENLNSPTEENDEKKRKVWIYIEKKRKTA